MRYVCNRDVQPETARKQLPATQLLAIDRIVEVTSVFAIDGDERQMPQIDTFLLVLFLIM